MKKFTEAQLENVFIELIGIEGIPHVASAEMQMAYSEDELSAHMEVLDNADVVPKALNDHDMDPKDIVYNGDLKKKDLEGFARTFDNTGK